MTYELDKCKLCNSHDINIIYESKKNSKIIYKCENCDYYYLLNNKWASPYRLTEKEIEEINNAKDIDKTVEELAIKITKEIIDGNNKEIIRTGKIRNENCPNCQSKDKKIVLQNKDSIIYKCKNCNQYYEYYKNEKYSIEVSEDYVKTKKSIRNYETKNKLLSPFLFISDNSKAIKYLFIIILIIIFIITFAVVTLEDSNKTSSEKYSEQLHKELNRDDDFQRWYDSYKKHS